MMTSGRRGSQIVLIAKPVVLNLDKFAHAFAREAAEFGDTAAEGDAGTDGDGAGEGGIILDDFFARPCS